MGTHDRRRELVVLVLGIAAVIALWIGLTRRASEPASHREIATRVLAEYLREHVRPKAVLVISNPFSQKSGRAAEVYEFERAGVDGLEAGFGKSIPLKVVYPRLRPEAERDPSSVYVDPNSKTPLSFLVAEDGFDAVIAGNRECDLVISLIGLPVNLSSVQAWTQPGAPRFALLLPDWRMIGNAQAVEQAFTSGKLAAAVVARAGGTADQRSPAGGDHRSGFEDQFILLTANNVQESLRANPRLLL